MHTNYNTCLHSITFVDEHQDILYSVRLPEEFGQLFIFWTPVIFLNGIIQLSQCLSNEHEIRDCFPMMVSESTCICNYLSQMNEKI